MKFLVREEKSLELTKGMGADEVKSHRKANEYGEKEREG